MNKQNVFDALRVAEEFSNFTDAEIRELVERCTTRVVVSAQPLWSLGEARHACFILLSGSFERRIQTQTKTLVQTFKVPGEVLSWSALVGDSDYYSSATALERSEVLVLEREAFQDMFENDAAAAYALIDLIALYLVEDMRAANSRLKEVFGRPAETLRMLRRRIRED